MANDKSTKPEHYVIKPQPGRIIENSKPLPKAPRPPEPPVKKDK